MINEFHAALVNRVVDRSLPGTDYVPSEWIPVSLSASASAVHRTLMINPQVPEACNWRALEIRRLLPRTDLASMRVRFDIRTGYEPSSLVNEMTAAFKPRVHGGLPGGLVVEGQLMSDTYRLFDWTLVVGDTNWLLEGVSGGSVSGVIGSNPLITAVLPGTENVRVRFTRDPANYHLNWASRPKINIATTAVELVNSAGSEVRDLAGNARSRWSDQERQLLSHIIFQEVEPAAKVCAASLLLAGHILHVDNTL